MPLSLQPSSNVTTNPVNISGLTDDQKTAYTGLMEFIKAPYDDKDYKRCLTGAGGTGKTFLLNALLKNCGMSTSTVGLAAPTHKACRILRDNTRSNNVHTLQSDLGIQIDLTTEHFDPKNPKFSPKNRGRMEYYKLYVIDECSMIDRNLCAHLEKKVKENSAKLIYVGDPSQLPPVGESYSPAFTGITTYALNQVVRQGDNNPMSELLALIRSDIKNRTFKSIQYMSTHRNSIIDDKGFEVLTSNDFGKKVIEVYTDGNLQNDIDYCKMIAYTNEQVSNWNTAIRNHLIENAKTNVINNNDLVTSYTTIVDTNNAPIIINSEDYVIKDVVNYIDDLYELKGYYVKFISVHGGLTSKALFVIDHSDPLTVRNYYRVAHEFMSKRRWKEYYDFKSKYLCMKNIPDPDGGSGVIARDLDYGFAFTANKAQGSTYNITFVDLNNIMYNKYGSLYSNIMEMMRRIYVACSRPKNKLYIRYDG